MEQLIGVPSDQTLIVDGRRLMFAADAEWLAAPVAVGCHVVRWQGGAGTRQVLPSMVEEPVTAEQIAPLVDAAMAEIARLDTPAPMPLGEAVAAAEAAIDAAVGRLRCRFITAIPGQEAVYTAKAAEAHAVLATVAGGGVPDPAACPHLARDAARHGTTLAEEAVVAAGMEALWLHGVSPVLEDLRLGGKERARAAADADGALAVAAAVAAVVPALLAVPDGPDLLAGLDAAAAAIAWPA